MAFSVRRFHRSVVSTVIEKLIFFLLLFNRIPLTTGSLQNYNFKLYRERKILLQFSNLKILVNEKCGYTKLKKKNHSRRCI